MKQLPTVFLIDDDEDLTDLIVLHVRDAGFNIEPFPSAEAFLSAFDPQQPGCLLLDIYMPGMSGLELQQELNKRDIEAPTIIITAQGDVPTAVQAMKAGAIDYIEKPLHPEQLLERIHECLVIDQSRRDKAARQSKYNACLAHLTQREYEVMEEMVAGKMNKGIAADLDISQRTVEDHRAKVMAKLQAKSIADVVRVYLLSRF
ncbi:MAG: response regulator [Mariprofundus sp.]